MNISLVLLPFLLFIAFARSIECGHKDECECGDGHEDGIGCHGGIDGNVMVVA